MPQPSADQKLCSLLNRCREWVGLHESAAQHKGLRNRSDDHPPPVITDICSAFRSRLFNRFCWGKVFNQKCLKNDPERFNGGFRIL